MEQKRWKVKTVFNKKDSEANGIARSSPGILEAACEPNAWRRIKISPDGQGSFNNPGFPLLLTEHLPFLPLMKPGCTCGSDLLLVLPALNVGQ